jgi:hypothetical protein
VNGEQLAVKPIANGWFSAYWSEKFKVQRIGRGFLLSQATFHNSPVGQGPMRNCLEKFLVAQASRLCLRRVRTAPHPSKN